MKNVLVGSTVQHNLKTRKITLTAEEVKALRATPAELVPAPGANKILSFVEGMAYLKAGSEGLTESADNLSIKYTNGSGVAVSETIECTGFIDQTADTATSIEKVKDAIVAGSASVNKALVLHNTGDGEIAGNASNDAELVVFVTYREFDVA